MDRLSTRTTILAVSLSALAGYVDAVGFLQLGGYFISFISGNSTQMAVNISTRHFHAALKLASIIGLFVGGTIAGTLAGNFFRPHRSITVVLSLVTSLLVLAAACASLGWVPGTVIFMTLAMGAENATFQRDGEIIVGVTYMTGTLVKMGQRIANRLMGDRKSAWIPYLFLWLGLITGGMLGALAFLAIGLYSLWIAAAWSAVLTVAACKELFFNPKRN